MPELPEVETIRRQLLLVCQDEVIQNIDFSEHAASLLQNCEPRLFAKALAGQRIRDLRRKGKFLVMMCDEVFPVFHLGMSGIFLLDRGESRYPQHIHLTMTFASRKQLFFQDMRRFGKIWLYREDPPLPNLGLDPVNEMPDVPTLGKMLQKRAMNIKLFLMDQGILAGIGNIYASEILHLAKISPLRKTSELSPAEIRELHAATRQILHSAIEKFGTTYSAYRMVNGQSGENQHFLQVYQRENQPCLRCGTEIVKMVLGSRSTFYCPNCQH